MSYIADDGDRGVQSLGRGQMHEVIRNNWKLSSENQLGAFKSAKRVFGGFFVAGIILLLVGIKYDDAIAVAALSAIVIGLLGLRAASSDEKKELNYHAAETITIEEWGLVVKTAGGLVLRAPFQEIGLIVDISAFINSYGTTTYIVPYTILVYYNPDLRGCLELYLDKEAGYRVITEYRKYLERTGIRSCPFITGLKINSDEINRPIDRLKLSAFCQRWYR